MRDGAPPRHRTARPHHRPGDLQRGDAGWVLLPLGHGADVNKLLGYRWNGHKFVQIPFQVDELATRYISNNASTFSFYSETDQHPTYVFDQERFRWTNSDPADPCRAVPNGPPTTPDTVPGLDTNDELSFMASDAG